MKHKGVAVVLCEGLSWGAGGEGEKGGYGGGEQWKSGTKLYLYIRPAAWDEEERKSLRSCLL